MSLAGPRFRQRHQGQAGVRGRRRQLGNSDDPADVRGGPGRPTSSGRAIHWHADPDVRIEFVSTDHERQKIPYVRLVGKDGKVKEYKAEGATDEEIAKGERRVMDCIDCHNVPAHRIAPTAEQAVDAAIANGSISRNLPFVRRESVRLVKSDYPTQEQGLEEIEKGVRGFYTGKKASTTRRSNGRLRR